MKRKVTIAVSPWSERPLGADECVYTQVEIDVPHDPGKHLKVFAVGIENQQQMPNGKGHSFNEVLPIIEGDQIDALVGSLLMYIDATFTDKDQRKAHKDIVRNAIWDWYKARNRNDHQTIEFALRERI